jgi:hypothetical protein
MISTGPAENGFDFALPGTWWLVPVADPSVAARSIARAVEQAVGRRDADARLRAELRTRFTDVADRARTAGAAQVHLCHEIVPGVPLPATLTVYWPRLVLRASGEDDPALALRALLGPPEGADAGDGAPAGTGVDADVTLDDLPTGPGIRRTRVITGSAAPDGSAPDVTTVEVDYWLATPGGRVLLLSFACGMPLLAGQLVDLFDLVVRTTTWRFPAGATEPARS